MHAQTTAIVFFEQNADNPSPVGHDLRVVPPSNAIIHKWITETARKFKISIDKYIIMPNHIHLLILIERIETERHAGRSLLEIIRWFKTMTTNDYIRGVRSGALSPFYQKLWQKSYYDHVVRNDEDYKQTWQYIENNPTQHFLDLESMRKKQHNPNL